MQQSNINFNTVLTSMDVEALATIPNWASDGLDLNSSDFSEDSSNTCLSSEENLVNFHDGNNVSSSLELNVSSEDSSTNTLAGIIEDVYGEGEMVIKEETDVLQAPFSNLTQESTHSIVVVAVHLQ